MNHVVTVVGDMNDADDASQSNSIDLEELVFEGWGENFEGIDITYKQFFNTFGEVLKEFTKANPHVSNWSDTTFRSYEDSVSSRTKVLTAFTEKLGISKLCDPCDMMEVLCDFIPGTFDYPVHTIYSITALPDEGQITFY